MPEGKEGGMRIGVDSKIGEQEKTMISKDLAEGETLDAEQCETFNRLTTELEDAIEKDRNRDFMKEIDALHKTVHDLFAQLGDTPTPEEMIDLLCSDEVAVYAHALEDKALRGMGFTDTQDISKAGLKRYYFLERGEEVPSGLGLEYVSAKEMKFVAGIAGHDLNKVAQLYTLASLMPGAKAKYVDGSPESMSALKKDPEKLGKAVAELKKYFDIFGTVWPVAKHLREDLYVRTVDNRRVPENMQEDFVLADMLDTFLLATDKMKRKDDGGVEIFVEGVEDIRDAKVHGNEHVLFNILLNVFNNAQKPYVQANQIWISCRRKSGFVEIEIKDDGLGWDPEIKDTVFEGGVSGTSSTGLGMAYADTRLASMGGEIEISSSRTQSWDDDATKHGSSEIIRMKIAT